MPYSPLRTILRAPTPWVVGLLLTHSSVLAPCSYGQVKIMPLGDSITQGSARYNSYRRPLWLQLQQAQYDVNFVGGRTQNEGGPPPNPDFDLDHQGHWGWTTAMLLAETRQWAREHQPDIVLLHAGTNDCFSEKPVAEIRDNLGHLIDELRAGNPQVKVLLAQLIPTAPPYEQLNAKITALNALLPALAQAKTSAPSPVVLVDHNTGFSRQANEDFYDGAHPNARGEDKLAARWYQALQAPELLGARLPLSNTPGVAPRTLVVSPIPAQERLTVQGVGRHTPVLMWDMHGRLVHQQLAPGASFVVDVSALAGGLYQVQAGGQRARFLKQ
ncbi:SGNH/GDSL hydrolase family protein [Hymenobacter sp. HD11105]